MAASYPLFNHDPQPVPNERGQVYQIQPDVEYFEVYSIGGYHPVAIGDSFHRGRYKVVHKLGYGGYSTVWLARDMQTDRYVTLKMIVANASTPNCTEALNLRLLNESSFASHPGHRAMPRLLNEFAVDGPNGRHTCLVLELACGSIQQFQYNFQFALFSVDNARSVAAQLILGLAYLHSRDMLHGDLKPDNFLISGSPLQTLSLEELYQQYPLEQCPIKRCDGGPVEPHAPGHAVLPLRPKSKANKLVDPVVQIIDYGQAVILADTPKTELSSPAMYSPPEEFFHDEITLAADVFSLGVSLFKIMGYRALFEAFGHRMDVLHEHIAAMGLPPSRWWDTWAEREQHFTTDGVWFERLGESEDQFENSLSQRMWSMGRGETPETCHWDYNGGEHDDLENMFRSMLAWEPKERPTAEELLKCDYMVKWGLPAWERQQERTKAKQTEEH